MADDFLADVKKEIAKEEGKDPTCQAKTKNNVSCQNTAVFPADEPKFCHLASHQSQYQTPKTETQDEIDGDEAHIFASKRSHQKLIINQGENRYIVRFEQGMYMTNDDKEAALILDYINRHYNLKQVIEKVQ